MFIIKCIIIYCFYVYHRHIHVMISKRGGVNNSVGTTLDYEAKGRGFEILVVHAILKSGIFLPRFLKLLG